MAGTTFSSDQSSILGRSCKVVELYRARREMHHLTMLSLRDAPCLAAIIDDHSLLALVVSVYFSKKTVGTVPNWNGSSLRILRTQVLQHHRWWLLHLLPRPGKIHSTHRQSPLSKRMWHLRSNQKTSFLWLLVSPRKSLQAHLLKLNLQGTWSHDFQQFTSPGLPANFLFFGLTYAMPQVFRCAIVGGVLR